MAANIKWSSHQNHIIPSVRVQYNAANLVVNRSEPSYHSHTLHGYQLYEIPTQIGEAGRQLEHHALHPPPLYLGFPRNYSNTHPFSFGLPTNYANTHLFSLGLPTNYADTQPQQDPPIHETGNAERGRLLRNAKVLSVADVAFNPIKVNENPLVYKLKPRQVTAPLTTEYGDQSVELLQGWKMEVRERGDGKTRDKFYSHPHCAKVLRSVAEVTRFVKSKFAEDRTSEEVEVPECVRFLEEFSSSKKRKKSVALPGGSERKRRRSQDMSPPCVEKETAREEIEKCLLNLFGNEEDDDESVRNF